MFSETTIAQKNFTSTFFPLGLRKLNSNHSNETSTTVFFKFWIFQEKGSFIHSCLHMKYDSKRDLMDICFSFCTNQHRQYIHVCDEILLKERIPNQNNYFDDNEGAKESDVIVYFRDYWWPSNELRDLKPTCTKHSMSSIPELPPIYILI